jgi:large subunit ribosomal protein L17
MRHRIAARKLGRKTPHRKALLANMADALVKHEQIQTTLPKAKELRPYVEKLVTLGKAGDLHARRTILTRVKDDKTAQKLIAVLADRYKARNGGYIRIMKAGFRRGDNAPMAIIEFVDRDVSARGQDSGPVMMADDAEAAA